MLSSAWAFCTPASRLPPSNSGSESSAPTPQAWADILKRSLISGVAEPPLAVKEKLGNQAALATPTRAWAARILLWAAAISGLRVSTVLGTPAGMAGKVVDHSADGALEIEAS